MQAAEAADLQGKYWEMHDLLFERLSKWSALAPADFETWAAQQAADLGLDPFKFHSDFNGQIVRERIDQAAQSTANQSIKPPILFVNKSSQYKGLVDFSSLDEVVRMEALAARQFSACPNWIIDPLKQYIVTLQTAKGNVVMQLFADKVPLAVNNFHFSGPGRLV